MEKPGDIIFLTVRTKNPFYRKLISKGIALFTRKKGQRLSDVKVHASIIYRYNTVLMVRDMDKEGDLHYTLKKYKEIYGNRMEILSLRYEYDKAKQIVFNWTCRNTKVKYDFINTFVFQVIKRLSGFFIGKVTLWKRMCAEDMQINMNILIPGLFKTPEATNPNEAYLFLKKRFNL